VGCDAWAPVACEVEAAAGCWPAAAAGPFCRAALAEWAARSWAPFVLAVALTHWPMPCWPSFSWLLHVVTALVTVLPHTVGSVLWVVAAAAAEPPATIAAAVANTAAVALGEAAAVSVDKSDIFLPPAAWVWYAD
jgi:hypothetical protein